MVRFIFYELLKCCRRLRELGDCSVHWVYKCIEREINRAYTAVYNRTKKWIPYITVHQLKYWQYTSYTLHMSRDHTVHSMSTFTQNPNITNNKCSKTLSRDKHAHWWKLHVGRLTSQGSHSPCPFSSRQTYPQPPPELLSIKTTGTFGFTLWLQLVQWIDYRLGTLHRAQTLPSIIKTSIPSSTFLRGHHSPTRSQMSPQILPKSHYISMVRLTGYLIRLIFVVVIKSRLGKRFFSPCIKIYI